MGICATNLPYLLKMLMLLFGSKLPNICASLFSRIKLLIKPSVSDPTELLSQKGYSEGVSGKGIPVTEMVNLVRVKHASCAFIP
jgi:hypothetical protein